MIQTKLIINSELVKSSSDRCLDIFAPHTNEKLGTIELATTKDVDNAYQSLKEGFNEWKNLETFVRYNLLKQIANELLSRSEEIAKVLSKEIAKPYKDALSEVVRSAEFITATAEVGRMLKGDLRYADAMKGYSHNQKLGLTSYEPVGIVLCISPFNYPINLSVSKIAPALMGGNCVLFKSPSQGSLSAYLLAEIFNKYLPMGVFNFVTGNSSEIGDYLFEHDLVDMINFTGSTQVGNRIKKQAKVPYLLELGGKDFAIVTKNANISKVVSEIVKGAFSYSGQRCTAIKAVLVEKEVFDQVWSLLIEMVKKIKVGEPSDDVMVSSLINKQAADYCEGLINDAKEKGASFSWQYYRKDNLIAPVLINVKDKATKVLWEEQFSPILPVFKVENTKEAIDMVNFSEYGLQADIFSQDISEAMDLANKIEVGTVQINGKSDRGPDNFPFSGVKSSGVGSQGIEESILGMMKKKLVVINS